MNVNEKARLGEDNNDVLVYDIECETVGDTPDGNRDKLKIFGFYSYKTNKSGIVPFYRKEDIQQIIDSHKFLVGFNNEHYDNPVLERFGFNLQYKRIIDLRKILKMRASAMITEKGMLGNVLMRYSLDYITRFLGLVDDDTAKDEIDYNIFKKNRWTKEEVQKIKDYTIRDIDITRKLYEWIEKYFANFKEFLPKNDVEKKYYLTDSIAKFAYKAICCDMGWEPVFNSNAPEIPEDERISGGYVAYPAGGRFEGNIYELDYSCLPEDTIIRCFKGGRNYFDKKIQNIQPGDSLLGQYGKEEVGGVNKQYYKGELIKIVLENGMIVRCTPEHKFPVYRNKKLIEVEAKNIKETDDMITTNSKFHDFNFNYKGKIHKMCEVCGTEFKVFPSQDYRKTCGSEECANFNRSKNSTKPNLGKTKYEYEHLMRMSKNRSGKERSELTKQNISEETKKAMHKPEIWNKFIEGQKNKDKSFFKTIDWYQKVCQSRMYSVKNGKFQYKGINFRSNWEVMFAKGLDKKNIKWEYEPKVFKLDSGLLYIPDFYLPEYDKWVEIKGYMYDQSREKIQQFMKNNELLLLTDLADIKEGGTKWLK